MRSTTVCVWISAYEKVLSSPVSRRTEKTAGKTAVTSPFKRVLLPRPLLTFISTGILSRLFTCCFALSRFCPISLIARLLPQARVLIQNRLFHLKPDFDTHILGLCSTPARILKSYNSDSINQKINKILQHIIILQTAVHMILLYKYKFISNKTDYL